MAGDPRDTPAMRQYFGFKRKHPGCLLMFRMGDFYEMFDEDAVTASRALGLTLTQRTAGLPMAGVPHHQIEAYLKRLLDQGFRVAVCDQVQDPKESKGIVARAVTRVLSPGTLVEESLIEDDSATRLGAACLSGERAALALVEFSTGEFTLLEADADELPDVLARRSVGELLLGDGVASASPIAPLVARIGDAGIAITPRPGWQFHAEEAAAALREVFGVSTLAGFGLDDASDGEAPLVSAAGAIVRYLRETQTPELPPEAGSMRPATLGHLRPPRREVGDDALILDSVTLRALEVERTIRPGAGDGSLVGLFLRPRAGAREGCRTPMGKRLAREWLSRPSRRLGVIRERHDAVGSIVADRAASDALGARLSGVQDIERIGARVALGRASPRDLVALARSIESSAMLGSELGERAGLEARAVALARAAGELGPIAERIAERCVDDAPTHAREGGFIRDGVDAALDEARSLRRDAGRWLAEYQARLIAEHGLPSLKVGYNRVFGYYIELPAAQARQAPEALRRTQTLKNAERYTTPELRDFESRANSAEADALERERALFDELCRQVGGALPAVRTLAREVAELDVLGAFAARALRFGWTRPDMTEDARLELADSRHPVLEELLGETFVPSDLGLGVPAGETRGPGARLALITGPNMAGKSTFIRQVALIALLAQAGSFVPASRATIGVADRIFTRVGAEDALHSGQSTFMVEMTEAANILNHASGRSLVILDEIGRGTSTLDGLSLAWAIAEHLARAEPPPRTLFATHYHELTDLADRMPDRVADLHVAVREWPPGDPNAQIVFLHRVLPGRTDRSYGLHVARLAGIPRGIVSRAREIMDSLAVHHAEAPPPAPRRDDGQLALFAPVEHPALAELRELKLEAITPLEAFDKLRSLKASVEPPRA